MIKGAIFCQVIKMKLFIQLNPSITFGNQKWNGAIPLFNINVEEKIKFIKNCHLKFKDFSIKKKWKIIENNKIFDAKAWIKKYFKVASEEKRLLVFIESVIKERRLISNPIQILNHEEEEILMTVPIISVIKNNIL